VVLPTLVAALAVLLAVFSSSDTSDASWALPSIPVAALIGAAARANELIRAGVDRSIARWSGITLAGLGVIVAYTVWLIAAQATCHGRYECPL
jgi:hypothetical protein